MSSRTNNLLEKMTLREKVGQLNQHLYGFDSYVKSEDGRIEPAESFKSEVARWSGLGFLYGLFRADPWSKRDYKSGLVGIDAPKTINMLQRYVLEHSRLEIPMAVTSECPHGNQILDGYLYPVNLAVGATFNPHIFERAAGRAGKQLKELGISFGLMSLLDVCRDPRWGRSEECFSEDPYLAAAFAAAGVRGMQKEGVGTVAKHLAGQGQTTGGVNASSALIGWNELKEIHLKTMDACAREKAMAVMAAYNDVDGVPCHANKMLLRDYLRGELSFDGLIMADGVAIDRLDVLTGDNVMSGAYAVSAGVEVSLWDEAFTKLEEAVVRDPSLEKAIDKAALHVLETKEKLGLFEHPFAEESDRYVNFGKYDLKDNMDNDEGDEACAQDPSYALSLESPVLLKNENNTLPINIEKTGRILLVGDAANDIYRQLGDYTPYIREENAYTVYRGVCEALKENEAISYAYMSSEEFLNAAKEGVLDENYDTVICVIGGSSSRFSGAEFDSNGAAIASRECVMDCGEGVDSANLLLPEKDRFLVDEIKRKCPSSKLITVFIAGRAYAISDIVDKSAGLLHCFYPGPMGGKAIAEIIFGKYSPSGILPVSIPRSASQLPCYYNFRASYEGMKYCDMEENALFSFGFGLSYEEFIYEDVTLKKSEYGTKLIVSLNVSCKGNKDRTEVGDTILVYAKKKSGITVPRVKELVGFTKVYVVPGERAKAEIEIDGGFEGQLLIADGRGEIKRFETYERY